MMTERNDLILAIIGILAIENKSKMGVKLGTMYYLSSSSNELDRKGINKDAPNGADGERKEIPKVTQTEML